MREECGGIEVTRGTTPTVICAFKSVDVDRIAVAILTIKRVMDGAVCIRKDLSDAEIKTKAITWTLSQEDTLSVRGKAKMMVNWLTDDGIRGTSKTKLVEFTQNQIEEVINA